MFMVIILYSGQTLAKVGQLAFFPQLARVGNRDFEELFFLGK